MKRKIALLLALVMVLSMVPMMSFAASDNSINRVPQVAKDAELNGSNAPKLRIEEKRVGEFGTEIFRLTLEGAEWAKTKDSNGNVLKDSNGNDRYLITDYSGNFSVDLLTNKTVQVTVYGPDGRSEGNEAVFEIPLFAKVTEEGEAKVTIDSRGSAVTGGTYVFANAAKGSTVTTVEGTVTFAREKAQLKTIEVDETKLGGFKGDKEIKFILTRDFVWADSASDIAGKIKFTGGYDGYTVSQSNIEVDGEELVITLDNLPNTSGDVRGTIFFEKLTIEAKRNAKLGDVTLRVRGDAENQELTVAKYVDYDVIIEADGDAKELFAGRLDSKGVSTSTHELQKLIIKEEVEGAWILDRKVVVEFPSFVKVVDAEIKKAENLDLNISDLDFEENVVEFIPEKGSNTGKAKLEIIFFVSIEADATGDIAATVSGRGLTGEEEIVLGKALAPATVKVDVKDVKLGVQRQEIGTITLSEVKDGGIMDGLVSLELEDGFRWAGNPAVQVAEGDLRIDEKSLKINGRLMTFEVTRSSDKASVIEITGAEVDLYRYVPEGNFEMNVGGSALVRNYNANATALSPEFRTQWMAKVPVAKVITPAPGETVKPAVALTIGVVPEGGDVAPYVKNNRTFAPVSAVAQALGVAKSNIIWNEEARTVTILGDKTVQMTIGSTTLLVNGTPVVMDVAPEITNSRTFLPIAWLAKALDVNYTWDAATQTVTFY